MMNENNTFPLDQAHYRISVYDREEHDVGIAGKLKEYFFKTERLFVPPISQRTDFAKYLDKLFSESSILYAQTDDGSIVGVASFYCTPSGYEYAFLTYIASSKAKLGIGSGLVQAMIEIVRDNRMVGIETQTWESNVSSRRLFQKAGFKEYGKVRNRDNGEFSILLRLRFDELQA